MNIHEYQAKELLKRYGVPVPDGLVAWTPDEAVAAAGKLPGPVYVVKSQIHAGGRGAGRFADDPNGKGGVRLARSIEEVRAAADAMLGHTLVTKQTGPAGRPVHRVYVEAGCDIARELYLSLLVDRASGRVTVVASTEGGMEIEEVAAQQPEKILRVAIDPAAGISGYLRAPAGLWRSASPAARSPHSADSCPRCIEPSPNSTARSSRSTRWSSPNEARMVALDAKISFDDNALFRHPELEKLHDEGEEDPKELEAAKYNLNYVALDGNIGCLVNGAGLAMATMDIIKLYGMAPANFLDVGGGATKERVTAAFKIILSDPNVEGILVNIFGGIMRCDVIAEGVVAAARRGQPVGAAGGAAGRHQRATWQGDPGEVQPADHRRRQPRRCGGEDRYAVKEAA